MRWKPWLCAVVLVAGCSAPSPPPPSVVARVIYMADVQIVFDKLCDGVVMSTLHDPLRYMVRLKTTEWASVWVKGEDLPIIEEQCRASATPERTWRVGEGARERRAAAPALSRPK